MLHAHGGFCDMHLLDEPLTLVDRISKLAEAVGQFPPCAQSQVHLDLEDGLEHQLSRGCCEFSMWVTIKLASTCGFDSNHGGHHAAQKFRTSMASS